MVDEVRHPEESDELDTWFSDEEESVDTENFDDEDSSPESDEEVEVPEEEVPSEAPETAATEGAAPKAETQEEDPYSWVAELDPDFQQKVKSLVNATKSNAGRAAAEARQKQEMQARLDRAQAELEAYRKLPTPGTPQKAVPTSEEIADMDDDELAEFRKEFPSVAASVDKMIAQREAKTRDEILAQIRPIQQEAEAAKVYERKQALRDAASHIFNTVETGVDLDQVLQSDQWRYWVSQQSPGYQRYIQTAAEVADAAKVLEDFADYANRQVYAQWEAEEQQRQAAEASQADETVARRKGNLKGTTPKSRTAQLSDKGRGASFEDYFDQFVEERYSS